jgi:hypothetical protein
VSAANVPIALARATAAATFMPADIEVAKAECAAATRSLPWTPPMRAPVRLAAATEPVAAWLTGPGTCAVASAPPSRDR